MPGGRGGEHGLDTMQARIEAAASTSSGVTFVVGGTDEQRVTWAQLHTEAREMAAGLAGRGVGPGDHVALLGPTSRPLVTAIQAVWLAGATLVVLPLPMRLGSIEEFVAQTRRRLRQADVSIVAVDPDLAPFIEPEPGDPPLVLLDDLARPAEGWAAPPSDPDALAVLQFTSGSTADPKGVMLPHRTVAANLDAIAAGAALDPATDVMVSWLPLYHDMGLVGFAILPMTTGTELVLGAPQDFLAAPGRWMEWIARHGGTATAGPNFSYVLAARALQRGDPLDLSSLRLALNGAEPVDPDTVERFVEAGARHGLRPGAIFPAFGMAEIVIGGTFPEPSSGMRTDPVDRVTLEAERYAAPADPGAATTRHLVRLGRALDGLELRIVDPQAGSVLLDREVGELQIRGSSVCAGYYGRPDATAETIVDGWLRTGDLGYLVDGELVICGRLKDVIIVGGRNVYPDEVERAVGTLDGVRAGNVIAFGVEGRRGKQELVVVAETRDVDIDLVRAEVSERVRAAVGLPAKDIVLVSPGTIPKTSSGKLQRSLCRDQYLAREL